MPNLFAKNFEILNSQLVLVNARWLKENNFRHSMLRSQHSKSLWTSVSTCFPKTNRMSKGHCKCFQHIASSLDHDLPRGWDRLMGGRVKKLFIRLRVLNEQGWGSLCRTWTLCQTRALNLAPWWLCFTTTCFPEISEWHHVEYHTCISPFSWWE